MSIPHFEFVISLSDKNPCIFPLVLTMTRIAIFASGAGSNAEKIIEYFKNHQTIGVALVVTNNSKAGVVAIAERNKIPVLLIEKEQFFRGTAYLPELETFKINFIVLAGFLWKIPNPLITAFPFSIVNIHPALLPSYGGKGMYGINVHTAVMESGDKESGITIHFVDEHYDNGDIIFQDRCDISPSDTPQSLAQKVHDLEYEHYPRVIEQIINIRNQR